MQSQCSPWNQPVGTGANPDSAPCYLHGPGYISSLQASVSSYVKVIINNKLPHKIVARIKSDEIS